MSDRSDQEEKVVYLVRHGQSQDNVDPVFQSPDSSLSATGRVQAERLAERVSRLSFEALISSSYPRALQTAEIIAAAMGGGSSPVDVQIEQSELFVERIKPASVNGRPYTDTVAAKLWREWEESFYEPGRRTAGGENFDDIVCRADRALAWLADRPESSLVVVTHGFFLRTLLARILLGEALIPENFRGIQRSAGMENTGLTVFRYTATLREPPSWSLWTYNDQAHLGE